MIRYDGDWKNDKRDGKGVFQTFGDIFEGDWVMGRKHGFGICTYRSGDRYEH